MENQDEYWMEKGKSKSWKVERLQDSPHFAIVGGKYQ